MNAQEQMREQLRMQMMNESLLAYYQRACGWTFWPLIFVGLTSIAFALAIVLRGRGATVGPALVLSVLLPPLLGLWSGVSLLVSTFRVIDQAGTTPDLQEMYSAYGMATVPLLIGLTYAVPTGLIALFGATIRAFLAPKGATLP